MRLRSLLDTPMPGLELLVGADQLDRRISWVATTDLLDPGRYLNGGELVLTGLVWRREPADSDTFVRAVSEAGVSALAAGDASGADLPDDLIRACRKHRIPLFRVPADLAFATLTEYVARKLSAQRASDIGSVLDRHEQLVSASAAGQALDPILELIAQDVGMACWVITSSGRHVAGSAEVLGTEESALLAHDALRARELPARIRRRSVFPISAEHRLGDWYLVFDGDFERWEPQRQALAAKVATVLAIERDRLTARSEPVRRLGAELIRLVVADGDAAEIHARAAMVGLTPDVEVQAVAVSVSGGRGDAAVLRSLLDDVTEPDFPVAEFDGHAIGLVPRPPDGLADLLRRRLFGSGGVAGQAGVTGRSRVAGPTRPGSVASQADVAGSADVAGQAVAAGQAGVGGSGVRSGAAGQAGATGLAAGLGRERLAVGIGDRRFGNPRSSVEEAQHALRIGRSRPDQVSVVAHHELASHVLLLSGLPEDVRAAYRDRLLGPLRAYDAAHRSDLETTLEAFLSCSTSWTKCAEMMHVHVNTLRYRIARIEELTGRDLSDLETQVDLFLALRLR